MIEVLAIASCLASAPPDLWGMAVALHAGESERRGVPFPPDLEPIAEMGAQAVLFPISWRMHTVESSRIARGGDTVTDEVLIPLSREAKARGFGVAWLPLIEIDEGADEDWRGVLSPKDEVSWWRSYEAFISHYARLANRVEADVLVIGSELTSMSEPRHGARWARVASAARSRFRGRLAYVANHDALERRAPFAHVDVAGVSAYFPLGTDGDLSAKAMRDAWVDIDARLDAFASEVAKPLVLFELGYPSTDGGAARPWDYTSGGVIDLEEQRDAYLAATTAISESRRVRGAFFWTWFGEGGPHDRWYTPRNKPAEAVVRAFFDRRSAERLSRQHLHVDAVEHAVDQHGVVDGDSVAAD